MRALPFLICGGLAGCTTSQFTEMPEPPASAQHYESLVDRATVPHVTRYELGEYRYPRLPNGDAEKAVYRETRVPAHVVQEPIVESVRASHAPLPPSAELAAELAAQREITRRLRETELAMMEIERQARAGYAALAAQHEQAAALRRQLEAERSRLADLEAQLRERREALPPPLSTVPASASTPSPKW